MADKMAAHCFALSRTSAEQKLRSRFLIPQHTSLFAVILWEQKTHFGKDVSVAGVSQLWASCPWAWQSHGLRCLSQGCVCALGMGSVSTWVCVHGLCAERLARTQSVCLSKVAFGLLQ